MGNVCCYCGAEEDNASLFCPDRPNAGMPHDFSGHIWDLRGKCKRCGQMKWREDDECPGER